MYWECEADVHNQAISMAMSRGKFLDIMKHVHLADKTCLDTTDKFAKVLSTLNERFFYLLSE